MTCTELKASVTLEQVDNMLHAIGYEDSKIRGRTKHVYTAWRNYYQTGKHKDDGWKKLCELGLARESRKNVFHVTEKGFLFLGRLFKFKFEEES